MDNIDKLIELKGSAYIKEKDTCTVYHYEDQVFIFDEYEGHTPFGKYICTIGEYRERLNPKKKIKQRKIIQILDQQDTEFAAGYLTALCDDGTIWFYSSGKWEQLKTPIPQDGTEW